MEVCMKKLFVAAVFTVFLVIGSSVFAQDKPKDKQSEYYYKNVTVEKIYPYRTGYVVQYRRGINSMDKAYLPITWFTSSAGKGEIVTLPNGNVWPSMTVYYKNGEFSHVRLYVHHVTSHETWGTLPLTVDLDSAFAGVEKLDLKF